MTGTIKTLRAEKGFGFIRDASGKEVFFHSSAIYGEGINDLREGCLLYTSPSPRDS